MKNKHNKQKTNAKIKTGTKKHQRKNKQKQKRTINKHTKNSYSTSVKYYNSTEK